MNFFPADPTKHRPVKLILQVEVIREMDRAIQEGLGGYGNRHELANDLLEQGLINLRFPDGEEPAPPQAESESEAKAAGSNGSGTAQSRASALLMPSIDNPIADLSETAIKAPAKAGTAVENELAAVEYGPMFGMHNRDAPTAWALASLARAAANGSVSMRDFYDQTTAEAWQLASQLSDFETKGTPKLAVMLPRNPEKPQSAEDGFKAFALGGVARKPNEEGKLSASGPFFQWNAVGLVGDVKNPEIGLTKSGWELVKLFDGLDFSIPHSEAMAERFLAHLGEYAPADLWGFQTALESASQGAGRVDINEYFRKRLDDDYSEVEWKGTVAESVASGYVSRARAWGLIEPKLMDGKYVLTAAGEKALKKSAPAKA